MTHATMPGLSLDATAKADDWVGPGLTYRVEAQFGLHVTQAQLHADLRAAPGCLAAHHPAVVISDDGHASIQLDVTAVDIWLALLEAMVSVKGVFHEPLAVRVVRSVGSDTTEYGATRATPNSRRRGHRRDLQCQSNQPPT